MKLIIEIHRYSRKSLELIYTNKYTQTKRLGNVVIVKLRNVGTSIRIPDRQSKDC